jgi:glycosyltransferase involved in cell wall biosynthesis
MSMQLLLDAVVFEYPPTGIAKVTAGLATACLAYDPGLSITAIHRRPLAQNFPSAITARAFARYLPYRLWRSVAFRFATQRIPIAWFPWNGDIPALPTSITTVTIIHDVLPLIIPEYFASSELEAAYRKRVQRDIDRTHLLFTDSEYSRQQIVSNFKARSEPKVLRFGPTLHPSDLHSTSVRTHAFPYFLYVGGYDKRKGIEQLLRVFVGLHKEKRIAARLILTGTKEYFSDSFRELVETGRSMHIVEETGYVDEPALADLFRNAIALVYPSRYEGFGLPPIEAMTAGCPVITTRGTSLPEVCGDAALYIDPDDIRSLGSALQTLEQNPSVREDFRQKGLRQAATFTWESAARMFVDALCDIERQRIRP